jgi:hypothetical protein
VRTAVRLQLFELEPRRMRTASDPSCTSDGLHNFARCPSAAAAGTIDTAQTRRPASRPSRNGDRDRLRRERIHESSDQPVAPAATPSTTSSTPTGCPVDRRATRESPSHAGRRCSTL